MRAGGGTPAGAGVAATHLIAEGATALISFGLAGGLDPALRPGTIILPSTVSSEGEILQTDARLADHFGGLSGHMILAGSRVVAQASEKRRLHVATTAHAIDLESGAVARVALAYGLPFVVVRAVCDPAERDLPPAALLALNPAGGIGLNPVIRSILRQPRQLPALIALARDAAHARRALIRLTERSQARLS